MSGAAAAPAAMDRETRLFWIILRRFEALAGGAYAARAPELHSEDKQAHHLALGALDLDPAELDALGLAKPVLELLAAASTDDRAGAVYVQGFILELLASVLYEAIATREDVDVGSRALAAAGGAIARATWTRAGELVEASAADGPARFAAFAAATHDVLQQLDTLGEQVDAVFGERFGLAFADLMGEFVADLLPACMALGMGRRAVVCHLTGALMGL